MPVVTTGLGSGNMVDVFLVFGTQAVDDAFHLIVVC
jgi:hypothetical protein